MIAISNSDFLKYGCPSCGCDSVQVDRINGVSAILSTCRECGEKFILLADGLEKSNLGIGVPHQIFRTHTVIEYPELQEHPRKGIPWHPWVQPDPRPEYGEYWKSRGFEYTWFLEESCHEDVLCGLVKSKQAGYRILEMVKEVLEKDEPSSWFIYCDEDPSWSQFKFRGNEFRLDKLDELSRQNNSILTKEILIESKIKNI